MDKKNKDNYAKIRVRNPIINILLVVGGIIMCGISIKAVDSVLLYDMLHVSNPTQDPLLVDLSNIISRYENGEISTIIISEATPFAWDRLFVFGPYTLLEKLESVVGRSWRKVCSTHIDVLEGYALLVFMNDSKVVHCLEYPIYEFPDAGATPISFERLAEYSSGIAIEDAEFTLDEWRTPILVDDK